MAIKKTIDIDVRGGDLKTLNSELNKVEKNLKDVDKSAKKAGSEIDEMTKNGGAIAILDGLTGGLATKFKDAFEATKLFNGSLKGLRGALIATGIGALVVALGTIIASWDTIKQKITGVNESLVTQLDDQRKITEETERQSKNFSNSENILRLQGKSEAEILSLKKEQLKQVLLAQEAELLRAKSLIENQIEAERQAKKTFDNISRVALSFTLLTAKTIDDLFSKLGIESGLQKTVENARGTVFDFLFGDKEGLDERKKEIKDLEDAILQTKNNIAGITLQQNAASEGTGETAQVSKVGVLTGIPLEELQTIGLQEIDIISGLNQTRNRIEQESADARMEIAEIEFQQRLALLDGLAASAQALSGILGQETGVGKALAVAASLINTYASIAGQLKAFAGVPIPGYAIAQAIATGLVGFKAVKDILSVQVPNTSAPSGAVGSTTVQAAPPTPPSFNLIGQGGFNQIAETLQTQEPVKAYVVSKDVSSQQELDRNIVNTASFG